MPRRLTPSKEEREGVVRRRMTPGSSAGGSRLVAPARRPAAPKAGTGVKVYFSDEQPPGMRVGDFWLDTDGSC